MLKFVAVSPCDFVNPFVLDCNSNRVSDQCDIASGFSDDFNGNGVPDECEPPPNDDCADAGFVSEGQFPFTTFGATSDGFQAACDGGKGFNFFKDIWYIYTPTCTGFATFSLCNAATFDTRLAVYTVGAACPPPTTPLACSDNAPGCGLTSELELFVVEGVPYLVRVGSPDTIGGTGTLTITCGP